ncbi:Uncharacterized protein AArcCO_2760 [Halalkaliarchaeum sp. AArc-CO]|uniref:toxin-antitoxin system TumE family protein n=1 Tax=Halalkaliarchaeum sp. AArc-CO TaxID=2866381 RepID=UPI00217E6667|nr:DUF6516 family protein [Halalkaliarchaeum sp. AArc-CO]UWG52038.1 Uncharacterized protein AArcCO_2760 [Halalkaliarchaeum sp. AArc-CO]
MADYETVEEYTRNVGDYVEHVRIRRTCDDQYPSGWDYALHYGTVDGETLLRYDNAHERTNGHERHTPEGVETITVPGMLELLEQFQTEVDGLPP